MLTGEWETLSEISKRTEIQGEEVIDQVKAEYQAGQVECKFDEIGGVKITQFRKKLYH